MKSNRYIIKVIFVFIPIILLGFINAQVNNVSKSEKSTIYIENDIKVSDDSSHSENHKTKKIPKLEIPKINATDCVISHTGYSFLYNETHEQSSWVAYELTKAETNKLFERTNDFVPDPSVKSGTANNSDYEASGYDRGHLAPASDMGWSAEAMRESFYFSNMSPQTPSFNRGIWKKLEDQVRTWAIENESVYIVTGPILSSIKQTIGQNKVSVPNYYYKVVLDYKYPNMKAIGFILPNIGSNESLKHFAVSIDSVEHITGIDFFPLLPDDQENEIENKLCITCWTWKIKKNSTNKSAANETEKKINFENTNDSEKMSLPPTDAVQCSAISKNGKRCKRTTTNSNGKCFQHEVK